MSKDGEEGFPRTLTAKVVYTLTNDNSLKIDYSATIDKTPWSIFQITPTQPGGRGKWRYSRSRDNDCSRQLHSCG